MLQKLYLLQKRDRNLHSCNFRIEINNNVCRCSHAKNNVWNSFSIDICTLQRISSKNVDLNIFAHT